LKYENLLLKHHHIRIKAGFKGNIEFAGSQFDILFMDIFILFCFLMVADIVQNDNPISIKPPI
jgi:hypothetical protein